MPTGVKEYRRGGKGMSRRVKEYRRGRQENAEGVKEYRRGGHGTPTAWCGKIKDAEGRGARVCRHV